MELVRLMDKRWVKSLIVALAIAGASVTSFPTGVQAASMAWSDPVLGQSRDQRWVQTSDNKFKRLVEKIFVSPLGLPDGGSTLLLLGLSLLGMVVCFRKKPL